MALSVVKIPLTFCCANCSLAASTSSSAASTSQRGFSIKRAFSGTHRLYQFAALLHGLQRGRKGTPGKVFAVTATKSISERYSLPAWSDFEMGRSSVFWETATGEAPAAGALLTIYFNPAASVLVARTEYGIGFNGGFNQPIMCGGEPRIMTRKDRGSVDGALYSIKINVPQHALTLEFSFTDGTSWDGPYLVEFVVPAKWRNKPISFFNEGLAEALSGEGACESAIYPEPTFVQDRCSFPANLTIEGGNRCELDLVPGCTDPENPFYNPLANVEDGSCPYISDSDTEI